MGFSNILALCGGLGLFLFGMKYMGAGLELAAGPKLNNLLEKLTRNPVMGFLLGVFVTACVQSSSATTIMCMGFLNAGIMDLLQAAGVILGANVGTTMTSILIALDVSWLAPVCIFVGALMQMFCKKKVQRYVGQIILGFGILFQGLHTMSDSMSGLKDIPEFQHFIASATNPLLGFVVGLILCGVIQSSFRSCRRTAGTGHAGIDADAFRGISDLRHQRWLVHHAVPVCDWCEEQYQACSRDLLCIQYHRCDYFHPDLYADAVRQHLQPVYVQYCGTDFHVPHYI